MNKSKLKGIVFFFLSLIVCFLSIDSNQFNSYKSNSRAKHLDYWVVHSIQHARQYGIFDTYTFTVIRNGKNNPTFRNIKGVSDKILIDDGEWRVYLSSLRWPNGIYKIIDKYFLQSKSPEESKKIIISIGALLASLCISLVLLWIFYEFGIISAVVCLFVAISSHFLMRLSLIAVAPYGMFLLPFASIALYLYKRKEKPSLSILFLLCFISFLMIETLHYAATPVVGMSCILPAIYYSHLYDHKLKIKVFAIICIAVLTAFLTALFLHYFLLYLYLDDSSDAIDYLKNRFFKRSTIAGNKLAQIDVEFRETVENSMRAPIDELYHNYFIYPKIIGSLKPNTLIIITFIAMLSSSLSKLMKNSIFSPKLFRLSIILLLSILGVVANLYIFGPHAYVHGHLDNVWWSLPFTMLVFIVPILMIEPLIKWFFRQVKSKL